MKRMLPLILTNLMVAQSSPGRMGSQPILLYVYTQGSLLIQRRWLFVIALAL